MTPATVPAHLPFVSVIMAAFQAAATLREAIDSVLAQRYPGFELVVVDDGSTDDTPGILASYGERIRVVRQPNRGLAAARNAGCAAARGEIVCLMDADDRCHPERIALQAAVMARDPAVVLCSSDFSAFGAAGAVSPSHGASYYSRIRQAPQGLHSLFRARAESLRSASGEPVEVLEDDVYTELVFGNFVHPPTVSFRRDALPRAGHFDERFRFNSDWEWMVRMSRAGRFAHVRAPLLDYRISASQMSRASGNGGRGAVEAVAVVESIVRRDPDLPRRHRHRLRRFRSELCMEAAYALSGHSKVAATGMLLRHAASGGANLATAKIAARILLPAPLLKAAARYRGTGGVLAALACDVADGSAEALQLALWLAA